MIAGLTVATVLTLVVVPVTYHSLDSLSNALSSIPETMRKRRERRGPQVSGGTEIHAREASETR